MINSGTVFTPRSAVLEPRKIALFIESKLWASFLKDCHLIYVHI